MKTFLLNNTGYSWTSYKNSYFKGYLYIESDEVVLREKAAIDFLINVDSFAELKKKMKDVDGIFSFVIAKDNEYWAGVDVARSMPLYYCLEETGL